MPPNNTHKRAHESTGHAGPDRKRLCKPKPAPNLIEPHPIVSIVTSAPLSGPKCFHVHKNYICHYSPFFRAAFASGCSLVRFHGAGPDIFGLFVSWLYTQTIECGGVPGAYACVQLWVLGAQILAPQLQNDALRALDQMRRAHQGRFPDGLFRILYELTEEGSVLREYVVAACAARNVPLAAPQAYPHAMLYDLVRRVKEEPVGEPASSAGQIWKSSAPALEAFYVDEEVEPEGEWLAAVARNALADRDLNAGISVSELSDDSEEGVSDGLVDREDGGCRVKVEDGENVASTDIVEV